MKSKNNIDFYVSEMIGRNKVEVFTERMKTESKELEKYEFIFKINDSTSKEISLFISDLYKLFGIVQKSLISYIENSLLPKVHNEKNIQLVVEAEGKTQQEIDYKTKLYNYHLDRLSKHYTDFIPGLVCKHTYEGITHNLMFYMEQKSA
jgi:hypothetical protein